LKLRTCLIAPLALSLPVLVSAQAPPARDAYIGIGLARLAYEIRTDGEVFFDTATPMLDLYGGFRISRHWSFEFSYQFTGSVSEDRLPGDLSERLSFPVLPGPLPTRTTARVEIATLRGLRHFRHDWGAWYLGIGVSGAALDTTFEILGAGGLAANIRTSKNGLTGAVGTEWTWSSLVLRLEYEWWDADMSSIGLSLHRRL
jgi:hypothetical protein